MPSTAKGKLLSLVVVAASLFSCASARLETVEETAFPLDEYPRWDWWESNQQILLANGYAEFFNATVGINVTEWWVVLVKPGSYEVPLVTIRTAEGTYVSDAVVFTDPVGRPVYPPVNVDADHFERHPLDGEMRVVAFAHFPVSPKGRALHWEVTP